MSSPKRSNASVAELLASLPPSEREKRLREIAPTPEDLRILEYSWDFFARPKQIEPRGRWLVWLILAGRGFGKTRTGAEWVRKRVDQGARSIYLVGKTAADVRDVMVEGESGILAVCPPWNRPKYEPSKRRLTWPNGARATCISADEPDQLRGPQADTCWADEVAAWKYPEAWDQVRFGLRSKKSGLRPQACITTTPRPIPLVKELVSDDAERGGHNVITRGSTYENAANLADSFFEDIRRKYEGTRLGRQELWAEILDDAPGALWKRALIEALRIRPDVDGKLRLPEFRRLVVAVDPAVSADKPADGSESRSSETGIIVAATDGKGDGYVLDDVSGIYTPAEWGQKVVEAFDKWDADEVVAEVNQGGDLVASNLRTVRRNLPIKTVRASRGKYTRAEPVAALYEQKRVHHVGSFPQLEDQQCSWEPNSGARSPDRLDAAVWGLTFLMVTRDPKAGSGGRQGLGWIQGPAMEDRTLG